MKETYRKRLGVCDGAESLTPKFHFLAGAFFVTAIKATMPVFGASKLELSGFQSFTTRSRSHTQLQDNYRAVKHFFGEAT